MPEPTTLRIAVAQSTVRQDPTDPDALRASGTEVRTLMKQAAKAGARLVHFPEGAICFPSKYVMSELGPDQVGPADWYKAEWSVLDEELQKIAALSRDLGIWTVIPSIHQLPSPTRPYNSQYVVSDPGKIVTRYDERTLSTTKISFMYTPGTEPATFTLDGFRFGLALGVDAHIPEVFTEYYRLEVDAVLLSYATTGVPHDAAATVTPANAAVNRYWISLATCANPDSTTPSAVIDPLGRRHVECPPNRQPAIITTDLHRDHALPPELRAWRTQARARVTS
jgi:predicted amidohydrolase